MDLGAILPYSSSDESDSDAEERAVEEAEPKEDMDEDEEDQYEGQHPSIQSPPYEGEDEKIEDELSGYHGDLTETVDDGYSYMGGGDLVDEDADPYHGIMNNVHDYFTASYGGVGVGSDEEAEGEAEGYDPTSGTNYYPPVQQEPQWESGYSGEEVFSGYMASVEESGGRATGGEDLPPVEEYSHYVMAVDVAARAIVVIPPGFDETRFVSLEKISPAQYNRMGRVAPSDVDINDDYFIDCDKCRTLYLPTCRKHTLYFIKDRIPSATADERAKATLPAFLKVAASSIPNAGLGVFTNVDIPTGSMFGPYQGVLVQDSKKADTTGYSWEIRVVGGPPVFIDGSDPKVANWMRYINNEEEQNLIAFQYNGSVYYRVFRPINAHQELLVWYGKSYGRSLGIMRTVAPTSYDRGKPLNYRNPFIY